MVDQSITKAVIPAAGMGTRFLPATKSIPKEMLPVVDKPAIQYVVEEAAAAGLTDVLLITGRGKRALEDHFDAVPELEVALEAKGDLDRMSAVRESSQLADIHYVRQGEPRGLGHAVGCAEAHVGDSPFAVLLGDDIIDPAYPLLRKMLAVHAQLGGSVVALLEVPDSDVHLYGSAAIEAIESPAGVDAEVYRITGLVEKPKLEDAPSRFAVIGRYVLSPAVFDVLRTTAPGRGGEIQLTDALANLATDVGAGAGGGVVGVVCRGRRFDTGDRLSYLQAVITLALERPDLGPELKEWIAAL